MAYQTTLIMLLNRLDFAVVVPPDNLSPESKVASLTSGPRQHKDTTVVRAASTIRLDKNAMVGYESSTVENGTRDSNKHVAYYEWLSFFKHFWQVKNDSGFKFYL